MTNRPDFFVSIEGLPGTGATNYFSALRNYVRGERAIDIADCPTPIRGTEVGDRARDILLDRSLGEEITPMTSILLRAVGLANLTETVISPALNAGRPVLAYNFLSDFLVNHVVDGELDLEQAKIWFDRVTGGIKPSKSYFIDASPERVSKILDPLNFGTPKRLEVYSQQREAFLQIAKMNGDLAEVINVDEFTEQEVITLLKGGFDQDYRAWQDS